MPTKVTASCLGLGAFAVATFVGLEAANPASQVLSRALLALAVCYFVGIGIGTVAERVVDLETAARRARLGIDDRAPGVGTEAELSEEDESVEARAAA